MTCESALRVAEWRLAQERRRLVSAERRAVAAPQPQPLLAGRPSLGRLYALWIGVGLVVLSAILFDWVSGAVLRGVVQLPYLLASLVALCGGVVHAYTFEAGVWRGLRLEAFPATPFGPPSVTRTLQRVVWHFHTVSWLATSAVVGSFAFERAAPAYAADVAWLLVLYWLAIVATAFFVTAFSLAPGDSYFGTLASSFQWVIVLAMVALMYWGVRT